MLDHLQRECLPGDSPCAYRPADLWYVAYLDGKPVAFGGVRPDPQDYKTWYLCRAGVLDAAQGKGIQKRLIAARTRGAKVAGATCLVTDTICSNAASMRSLLANGFKPYWPSYRWALDSVYWKKHI